ncbi:MAG: flagellar basal body rod protein FlgB [Fibrobacterota bacterium]
MIQRILSGTKLLTKNLDARAARNRVISNNIANAATPGYNRKEVRFEDSLRKSLDRRHIRGEKTASGHMNLGSSRPGEIRHTIARVNDPTLPSGVNNVDIDREMADLAENEIGYRYGIKFLSGRYKKINAAIKGTSMRE